MWNDADGNGIHDPAEQALAGQVIFLDSDRDSTRDADESYAVTDLDGRYVFNGLAPGEYSVRQELSQDWAHTWPASGSAVRDLDRGPVYRERCYFGCRDYRPVIVVGSHRLLPNTPNQTFPIYVTGGGPVQGLNFYIQVGDGGVPAGGTDVGPVITSVDILGGTIFQSNNNGAYDTDGSGANDTVPMFEGRTTSTASGSVNASGLLGTVTIDTTGLVGKHTWALKMANTRNGSTDFAGVPANITNGTLSTDSLPVANADAISVAEGGTASTLVGGSSSLLANDTDDDVPDTLTVDTTPVTGPSHGTLVLHADGTFSYTHDGSEVFTDSFAYRISDDAGQTATATVTITITPVNDNPPAITSSATPSVPENTTAVQTVTATDADLPGDTLVYSIADGPDGAQVQHQ